MKVSTASIAAMLAACSAPRSPAVADPARRDAPSDLRWESPIELARGGGHKGPWKQNDSRFDYVDDPTVAFGPGGQPIVAWADQRRKDVFVVSNPRRGAGTRAAIDVSRSPDTFSWLPRLAVSPRDPRHVYLLWQEMLFTGGSHGGDIHFARSTDGGATWSAPQDLSRASRQGDGKGRITSKIWHNGSLDLASGDHLLVAAWTDYEGSLYVAISGDAGESFSEPRVVAGDPRRPARAPALAIAPAGDVVYLAWTLGEDPAADVHLARSRDGGRSFEAPTVVRRTPGYSDAPKLAVDREGALHLAYAESSGGPFERFAIHYTRSSDGGRTFDPARTLSRRPGAFPALALDDRGTVVVVWEAYHEHRQLPRGLVVAYSLDGGQRFSRPDPIPGSADPDGGWNGSHQGRLMRKLAVRAGTIAVVNASLEPGDHSRVWLVRGRFTDAPAPPASAPSRDAQQALRDRD